MNARHDGRTPKRSSPEPERPKSTGNWKTLVKEALEKKKPPEGWPKPKNEKKKGWG